MRFSCLSSAMLVAVLEQRQAGAVQLDDTKSSMVTTTPSDTPDAYWLSQSSKTPTGTGENWDELVTAEVTSQNEAETSSEIMMSSLTAGVHD